MNTYRTEKPRQRCEVDLYYEACERLDLALRQNPEDREMIARLTFKKNEALNRAHAALGVRERSADENIAQLLADLKKMTNAIRA